MKLFILVTLCLFELANASDIKCEYSHDTGYQQLSPSVLAEGVKFVDLFATYDVVDPDVPVILVNKKIQVEILKLTKLQDETSACKNNRSQSLQVFAAVFTLSSPEPIFGTGTDNAVNSVRKVGICKMINFATCTAP